tara:strand:- start:6245 stop:7183 length:939 start_codon:yes stop_codon:yes gene_type:complete
MNKLNLNDYKDLLNLENNTPDLCTNTIDNFIKTDTNKHLFIGHLNDTGEIIDNFLLITKNKVIIEGNSNASELNLITDAKVRTNKFTFTGTLCNFNFKEGIIKHLNSKVVLSGSFQNGLPHGLCKAIFDENNSYDGNWDHGNFSGYGDYISKEFSYSGYWTNNAFNGNGILKKEDSTTDINWIDGLPHGEGKLTENNNEYYIVFNNGEEITKTLFSEKKIEDLELQLKDLQNQNNLLHTSINDLNSLKDDHEELEQYTNCKICYENKTCIVLKPCNHLCLCETCERTLMNHHSRTCPICRKRWTDKIKIFCS